MQYDCRICFPKQYNSHHHNVMDETNCHKFGQTDIPYTKYLQKIHCSHDPSVISADENDA